MKIQAPTSFEETLQSRFNLPAFRRGQREIISDILAGKDVLAVLPTGGGKSLCYQFPAILKGELVIVVSPLIALMKDQVAGLRRLGIPAGALHSGQSDDEKREIFRNMELGGPYLLYLSPERVAKEGFQRWIQNRKIALFAIDESHCVSQWGHDFRDEYALLGNLKTLRPDVPMLALTASATPMVLNDISRQLSLKNPARHVHGFYRSNLFYQVETCSDEEMKQEVLKQALRQFPTGRVIVYCGTRRTVEELAVNLDSEFQGVGFYHAGMTPKDRTQVQEGYGRGDTRILIATNAFGMGIDHPDVRLVVHFQMPGNIDALYQEMGRAGRDGLHSTCVMLYAKKDKGLQSFFIQQSKAPGHIQSSKWNTLDNLVEYAEGSECRHAEILTYYHDSQRLQRCGHCDNCAPASDRRVRLPAENILARLTGMAGAALKKSKSVRKQKSVTVPDLLTPDQQKLFEGLREWRREKARELDVPAFVVLSDRTLRHLAQEVPRDTDQLKRIYGLGEAKIEQYGLEIISELIAQYG